MRYLMTIITVWIAITSMAADSHSSPSSPMVTVDMRHGLPESRVRALLTLPDGQLVIATAGCLSIFDGVIFTNEPVNPENGVILASMSKNRQLSCDSNGIIWLKTPVTRQAETGRLHIFDSKTGAEITSDIYRILGEGGIRDVYVNDAGSLWVIDMENNLCAVRNGERKKILNLDSLGNDLPSALYGTDDKIYLCYDNGNVCVIDAGLGQLEYMSRPELPKKGMRLANSGAKWAGGRLLIPYHKHNDRSNTWIARLDTLSREWQVSHINKLVYDFTVDTKGEITVSFPGMDDSIFCMTADRGGGLWIGTRNSGLRYINSARSSLVVYSDKAYPYPKSGYYTSERARMLADKYATGIINCSAEDSITGYVYLGTRKGLMVIDNKDCLVAVLDENVGLSPINVQSVLANVRSGNAKTGIADDVWFSTTTGFSRLRHLPDDTVEVITLGILEGLDLNGKELPSQTMSCDSFGYIVAGYPGGSWRFNPSEIDDIDYVVHRFPDRNDDIIANDNAAGNTPLYLILTCVAVLAIITVLSYYIYMRKRNRISDIDDTEITGAGHGYDDSGNIERVCDNLVSKCFDTAKTNSKTSGLADMEFKSRINEIIEAHIDDESLSVVSLSSMMAMDRTSLYRKMQTVMGESPSSYIKNMRLAVAARLLDKTDLSIHDVAVRTGFSSTKYFSSAFKEKYGVLPAKYRMR